MLIDFAKLLAKGLIFARYFCESSLLGKTSASPATHLAALGRHLAAHRLTLAGTGAGNWHHANSAGRRQSDSIGTGHRWIRSDR